MRRKKFVSLLIAGALATASFVACGNADNGDSADTAETTTSSVQVDSDTAVEATTQAGKVVVAVDDDSFTIGPWGNDSSVRDWTEQTIWAHLCYRPFIGAMLENDELQMYAAKSVTKVDDSTYSVELYDNIVDSQGNAITAADVVFSYDKLAELGFVSEISLYYDSSEVTGDYSLDIKLKDSSEGAIEAVLCDCSIASQAWYENASENEINSNPATTGAYYITNMETGSSVTLEAKDDYWKSENKADVEYQNVKEIEIRCITEASARAIALENGEIDMAEISQDDISRFEDASAYNTTRYLNAMSQYLIFNTSEGNPCADVNVRKAIAYAFDAYTMSLTSGECVVSYDVAPNLAPDYVEAWDSQEYFSRDLEKAKEYLEAAGYSDSNPLTISILVTSQAPQQPYVALQSMLAEAGITLEIDAQDRAARQAVQSDPTAWDISEYSDQVVDFTTTFWNDLFGAEANGGLTQGFTDDEQLQELLKAAIADRSEENMNAFHDYVVENCYMVGLYTETKAIVTTSGITNISIEKLNPVINAMTFADDYQSVQ
ncbi:MAG: ABC transporter substrate-binding protein [Pseudobutyrivibrio ruminis]|uniref:ABC transporter substrate-binding protein n=1 Tax=Pseudobutyrivibrio ruminis TaxID=46206 RepID=UPI0026EFF7CE|nr:ABC transporter substrate-binding protein [Pseudobutyrivibrio ruminis]MBE5912649.1 ABC transporter substrate-binding protein [Pseudobutyrivibrio ruminis]